MRFEVIGVGGTGGWFVPALVRTELPENSLIMLFDPDIVERKNLARQNFRGRDLGTHKVAAFKRAYPKLQASQTLWTPGASSADFVFCFADNHQCRLDVLGWVDGHPSRRAIITGNEFASADAYYYQHGWAGSAKDPRIRFPEMTLPEHMTRMSCASAPVAEQSVLANQMASTLALVLLKYWLNPVEKKSEYYPVHFYWGGTRIHSKSSADLAAEPTEPTEPSETAETPEPT